MLPPLIDSYNFTKWIYKALSFLAISCPCALVLSIPLAFYCAIGKLAKSGILVKGGDYIEKLAKTSCIVFDKTGTLTKGELTVSKWDFYINLSEKEKADLYSYVKSLEIKSNHPLARAIVKELALVDELTVENFVEIDGKGVMGRIDSNLVIIGNLNMLIDNEITPLTEEVDSTFIYVSVNKKVVARVNFVDQIKENVSDTIKNLKNSGVSDFLMLSGDNETVCSIIAKKCGIEKVYSNLLPDQKLQAYEKVKEDHGGKIVAYCGDGINDAPTLAVSDVGISMGNIGSEIALQSSDVIILNDDIYGVFKAIKRAKKTRRKVVQNIIFSIFVKVAVMVLALIFTMPVYVAVLSDVGCMIIAVLNSISD